MTDEPDVDVVARCTPCGQVLCPITDGLQAIAEAAFAHQCPEEGQ